MLKHAEGESSGGSLLSAAGASPLPQPQVVSRIAPGKRGPIGMAHRNNFTRVNSGAMPAPDAGATSQKSLTPKYGSIMKMVPRPTLQDMIKSAQEGALSRVRIADEARRMAENISGEKLAADTSQEAPASISTDYVEKIAKALDFVAEDFQKSAAKTAPPAHITENLQEPGKGPGALEVSHATASTPLPDHKGQAHQQPPTKPGMEKVRPSDQAANALDVNNASTKGKTPQKVAADLTAKNLDVLKKIAAPKPAAEEKSAADLASSNLARLRKIAEDAINPAHISAGPAVPPETSAAGQAGGAPAGGKPGPGADLVSSNDAAIKYTKGQAKSGPKSDMKKWLDEPALTSQTDSALRAAFDSTPQAGTKFGSAQTGSVKVAAAKAFLESLLEEQPTV